MYSPKNVEKYCNSFFANGGRNDGIIVKIPPPRSRSVPPFAKGVIIKRSPFKYGVIKIKMSPPFKYGVIKIKMSPPLKYGVTKIFHPLCKGGDNKTFPL